MIPSAADIMRTREILAVVLAILGIALFLAGIVPLGMWITEGVRRGDLGNTRYNARYTDRMMLGIFLSVIGLVCMLFRRRLAALLVRPRPFVCPSCSYPLDRLTKPRCPECGLVLTDEFLDPRAGADCPASNRQDG